MVIRQRRKRDWNSKREEKGMRRTTWWCSVLQKKKSKSNTIQRWRIWPWERGECTSIHPKVIEYNLSELTWWFLFFTFDIKVYLFSDNWGHSWGREFKDLKYTHMHTHPQIIFYIAVYSTFLTLTLSWILRKYCFVIRWFIFNLKFFNLKYLLIQDILCRCIIFFNSLSFLLHEYLWAYAFRILPYRGIFTLGCFFFVRQGNIIFDVLFSLYFQTSIHISAHCPLPFS